MPFRLLLTPPLSGPDNMALDDALLWRARQTGECVLRVYAWVAPTLSFGRNQTARGLYDPVRLAERGVDVVRRPTGGRAVLHHREVTYSVTAPVDALSGPPAAGGGFARGARVGLAASYDRINRVLLAALRRLGVDAHIARPTARAPVPDGAPCFDSSTGGGGELVVNAGDGTAKLVGSAQWRDGDVLLQHGSILIDDDQSTIAGVSTRPLAPAARPATLRSALGRAPALGEVADALFAAVRAVEDPDARPLCVDDGLAAAARGARARYVDDAWTWRR